MFLGNHSSGLTQKPNLKIRVSDALVSTDYKENTETSFVFLLGFCLSTYIDSTIHLHYHEVS
jgi:hypothetical protein